MLRYVHQLLPALCFFCSVLSSWCTVLFFFFSFLHLNWKQLPAVSLNYTMSAARMNNSEVENCFKEAELALLEGNVLRTLPLLRWRKICLLSSNIQRGRTIPLPSILSFSLLSCFHFFQPPPSLSQALSSEETGKSSLCTQKKKKKTCMVHESACMKALKLMLLGHFGVSDREREKERDKDGQERGVEIREMALTEEEGDGGGRSWRAMGRKGRQRGAECSFKWKLALSLMAGTSNDDPPPPADYLNIVSAFLHAHTLTHNIHITIIPHVHARTYWRHTHTHPPETWNSVKVWWCIIFLSTSIHLPLLTISHSLLFTLFIFRRMLAPYLSSASARIQQCSVLRRIFLHANTELSRHYLCVNIPSASLSLII